MASTPYVRFYWSDWIADTSHLDLMQLGAYMRLLEHIYQHGRPLPGDMGKVFRICHATSTTEQTTIKGILEEFFVPFDDPEHGAQWRHLRAEREIDWAETAHAAKSEKAKHAALSRWGKPKVNAPSNAPSMLQASLKQCSSNANQNQNQIPTVEDREANASLSFVETTTDRNGAKTASPPEPRTPNCPHAEILAAYRHVLPELPQPIPSRWPTSAGAQALRARWGEDARHRTLEFWRAFFATVRSNPHWMGANDREWRADLPWLVKRANFDKVLVRIVAAKNGGSHA